MRNPILLKLIDAAVDVISKPLASSLGKSDALHPKFRQSIVKYGQRYHYKPVDEEKAIQTAANLLVRYMTKGAFSIAVVYLARSIYLDYQNVSELEQNSKQHIQLVKQELEKNEQEINRLRQRLKMFKLLEDDFSKAAIRGRAESTESEKS